MSFCSLHWNIHSVQNLNRYSECKYFPHQKSAFLGLAVIIQLLCFIFLFSFFLKLCFSASLLLGISWKQAQFYKNTFFPAAGVSKLPMLVSEHTEAQSSRDLSKAMSVGKLSFSKVLPVITALTKWIHYLFLLQLPFSSCALHFKCLYIKRPNCALTCSSYSRDLWDPCVMTHLQLFASLAKEWWQKESPF